MDETRRRLDPRALLGGVDFAEGDDDGDSSQSSNA
jgi:hypothetical protein